MPRATLLLISAWLACAQAPEGAIHGVVKDARTGEPLPDFTIRVVASDPPVTTVITHRAGSSSSGLGNTSDSDGRYTVTGLPAGTLTVVAENPRRQIVTQQVQLNPGDNLPVDFVIPPNATVSGHVLAADKRPIAGAMVWVVQSAASHYSLMGPYRTSTDGSYRFDYGLDAGRKYYLLVERPPTEKLISSEPQPLDERPAIEVPTYYGGGISIDTALPIILRSGEQFENADIKIATRKYYCVDGTITALGQPAALRFLIQEPAFAGTSFERLIATSHDDGSFRACGLTSGQYRILTGTGQVTGTADFAIAGSDVHGVRGAVDAASLRLQVSWDGDAPPDVENVVAASTDIKFGEESLKRMRAASRNVTVSLGSPADHNRLANQVTVPFDGDFGRLSAGEYTVSVKGHPSCCYLKSMRFGGAPVVDQKIHLAPGVTGILELVIATDIGNLTCKTTDSDGKPLAGWAAWVIPDGETIASRISPVGGDGQRFSLPPGKYRVLAPNRAALTPEDMEKMEQALAGATVVEIGSKAKVQVSVTAVNID